MQLSLKTKINTRGTERYRQEYIRALPRGLRFSQISFTYTVDKYVELHQNRGLNRIRHLVEHGFVNKFLNSLSSTSRFSHHRYYLLNSVVITLVSVIYHPQHITTMANSREDSLYTSNSDDNSTYIMANISQIHFFQINTVSPGRTKIVRIFLGRFMTCTFKDKRLLLSHDLAIRINFFQHSNSYVQYRFEIFKEGISFRLQNRDIYGNPVKTDATQTSFLIQIKIIPTKCLFYFH